MRRALPMSSAIEAMRSAFRDLASGAIDMPQRTRFDSPAGGITLVMPARSASIARQVLKFLTFYEGNPDAGLPLIQALVVLADDDTGIPLSLLDGTALTALRTGAVAGLATEVLARADDAVVAIFGAGVQARSQLEAVAAVRRLREVRIYDPDACAADSFVRDMSAKLGVDVRREDDASTAVRGADIIATATTSRTPVFDDRDVADGAHINAIGSYQPEKAEIPARTVCRARVVVDQREAALEEAGDLIQPLAAGLIGRDRFEIQLGDILLGRAEGRRSASEITLFKSVGLAVQDLYAASWAYENARRAGFGRELAR